MIRRFFADGMYWVVIFGLVMAYAIWVPVPA